MYGHTILYGDLKRPHSWARPAPASDKRQESWAKSSGLLKPETYCSFLKNGGLEARALPLRHSQHVVQGRVAYLDNALNTFSAVGLELTTWRNASTSNQLPTMGMGWRVGECLGFSGLLDIVQRWREDF